MFIRYNIFAICWALFILLLTLTPGENMPQTDLWYQFLNFDKVVHFFIFGVLVFLLIIGLSKQYTYLFLRRNAVRISIGAGVLYGIGIELIQNHIPGRSLELADMVANTLGCFIGYGMFYIIYKTARAK